MHAHTQTRSLKLHEEDGEDKKETEEKKGKWTVLRVPW